ncbi:GNAT family N-acetyltransferase [Paenibacillus urinalis]|uniref:GNAT family N-acetyltransferase n=1 Tax=Paenibacillus urinalis TaxID=521520 RepID=UPI00196164C5
MVLNISLQDRDLMLEVWKLQQMAYRLEAELIGFHDIPPLLDTIDSLQECGETFYGYINEDMELIGAISVEQEWEDSLTISRMMVHPNHFRRGVAGQLIQYVLDQYSEMRKFIVSTGMKNTPAVMLYQKYGFEPVQTSEIAPNVELTTFHLNRMYDRS